MLSPLVVRGVIRSRRLPVRRASRGCRSRCRPPPRAHFGGTPGPTAGGGFLLRHDSVESRVFFVATVNDDVVGWVHLNAPEIEKLSQTAELTVGVIDQNRGHSKGSHLLGRGLEWAKSEGYEKIYSSVPSTNEGAIEFLRDR
ncbi:hypothetical protein BRC94_01025, partial [Halobacteriales archaeon QS_5_70_17]